MSKLETNTIDTVSGTSTLQVGSTNTSTITLGVSGDTINVPSGVTINNNGTQTGFGGTNTPYFMVKKDSDQTCNHGAYTKITFDSTVLESSSNVFDLTNNKWTVATAGKYIVMPGITLYDSDNRLERGDMYIYKNGSIFQKFTHFDYGYSSSNSREYNLGHSFIASLAVNDYIEMYVYQNTNDSGSIVAESDHRQTYLSATKIIE